MTPRDQLENHQVGIDIGGIGRSLFERVVDAFGGDPSSAIETVVSVWQVFSIVSFGVSALLLFGIIYGKLRANELEELEHKELHDAEHEYAHEHADHGSKNPRWEQAVAHADSENPNDWRLAIIEADIILEEVLNTLGYGGVTIGDKLKQASPQFFKTLEDAWKAHKMRNDIAHRGSDFVLTKRMAKETLAQYERVFEEHGAI